MYVYMTVVDHPLVLALARDKSPIFDVRVAAV
jgi:hypothetical protein